MLHESRRAEPRIESERVVLRIGADEDAPALLAYILRNREYHQRWEPRVREDFFTLATQRRVLARRSEDFARGEAACFLVFDRTRGDDLVIARCNFTEIVRGPFQACYLGYSIDREYEGKRYMSEALRAAIHWAFGELRLHRIMANHRPENVRSERLLQRLGFVAEGYARDYLFIDGHWTDHVLRALVNPNREAFEQPV